MKFRNAKLHAVAATTMLMVLLIGGTAGSAAALTQSAKTHALSALNQGAILDSKTPLNVDETKTANQAGTNELPELKFSLVPAVAGGKGEGVVNMDVDGLTLEVQAQVEGADAATSYMFVVSINGASHTIGTILTDADGSGEIEGEVSVSAPGTYDVGVSMLAGTTIAFNGDPSAQKVTLPQPDVENEDENQAQQGDLENVAQLNQKEDQDIKDAKASKMISAVVEENGSDVRVSTLDPKFSVSVGHVQGDGLSISISAQNVTGPRVMLVTLDKPIDFTSKALVVTMDGATVAQASSVSQVLNPAKGDPARYIVVGTSSGQELLISIPHFSLHVIQFLPVALTPSQSVARSRTLIVAVIAIVTVAFAILYLTRKRTRAPTS
jgi:hypothetical protein